MVGVALLAVFLVVHVHKDMSADVGAWYFHSTWVWIGVMAVASGIFVREMRRLKRGGGDAEAVFRELPRG